MLFFIQFTDVIKSTVGFVIDENLRDGFAAGGLGKPSTFFIIAFDVNFREGNALGFKQDLGSTAVRAVARRVDDDFFLHAIWIADFLINDKYPVMGAWMNTSFTIFALSDATGELASSLTSSAIKQFPENRCKIVRVPKITDKSKISEHVVKAKACEAIIVFTFVSTEMREEMISCATKNQVVAVDILGPVLDAMSKYFHSSPSTEPGLQYRLTQNYFKRTEAVEFTVKHDDGLGLDSVDKSDIILIGISRTSKTPLSIYLAYHGYNCSNVPLIKGVPLPSPIKNADLKKVIGLTIDANKLATIRSMRLKKLGQSGSDAYANISYIRDEIEYAHRIFRDLQVPFIDVTGRAIEETASEVLNLLNLG